MTKDFPAAYYQTLVGAQIVSITDAPDADEGLLITFADGRTLRVAFSGCEGEILIGEEKAG